MITMKEAKNIRLSKNFTLDEFLKSDIALRYDIGNSMPRKYLVNIQYLVDTILQPIRDKFGPIRITSGYRCKELNIKIASSTTSNHAFGLAADIEPYDSGIKLSSIMKYVHDELVYKELIAEYFPYGWVHVAAQKGISRKIIKLKDKDSHYTRVTMNTILAKYSNVA